MGKVGEELFEFLVSSIKKLIGDIATFSINTIMAVIGKILQILKQGRVAIRTAIDEIFMVLENAAKLGREFIEKAAKYMGIKTDDLSAWLDDMGMSIVKFDGERISMCSIRT